MIITRAAIMFSNGEVVEGHAYGNILTIANKLSIMGDKIYGFMTSDEEFVLPVDAAIIAISNNQLPLEYFRDEEPILKPEDLWSVGVEQ